MLDFLNLSISAKYVIAILALLGGFLTWVWRRYQLAVNAERKAKDATIEELQTKLALNNPKTVLDDYRATKEGLEELVTRLRSKLERTENKLGQSETEKKFHQALGQKAIADRTKLQDSLNKAETRESVLEMMLVALKNGKEAMHMEYEEQLREELEISKDAKIEEILALIAKEGFTHQLLSGKVDGEVRWACPISKGIFQTIQRDNKTGMMGQAGSPTAELAALEGLRRARDLAAI